jgi:amino acid transporter
VGNLRRSSDAAADGGGSDRMLPAWFSRLRPVHKTPVNSIAVVGAASLGVAVSSLVGVGQEEAFQLVFNASGIFYALTSVVMFAIPLFGLRGVTPRPPVWLRLAALSLAGMAILFSARQRSAQSAAASMREGA